MSYLLLQEVVEQENTVLINKILSQIRFFMINELKAMPASYQNTTEPYAFVSTVKGKIFQDIQIYWVISFDKLGLRLKGKPSSLKSLGVDLVVNSQRLYIDLSKLLVLENKKLKNRYKIFIDEASHICIQAYIGYQQI